MKVILTSKFDAGDVVLGDRGEKHEWHGIVYEVSWDKAERTFVYRIRSTDPHNDGEFYGPFREHEVELGPGKEAPKKLNRAERFNAQVAHIREHPAEWAVLQGDADVASYMADYGDRWDLYQRVCDDMGIPWKPEICHPNPEN